ncbi:hypothetical protein [Clostridium estertheticum]|uniref:Uncharacterized protein n=1 Tax=Clostridium estertheticum TaxID=238834 RepID=A0AA47EIM5_9CLOT|nr:hypothetical protein [Clostridium estertheticum]MBU3153512.1 hypothetical protein [Clostridium estertheticum]WAG60913.1 hypothetical protein LL038_01280 [Clostridium estertheticum]
MEGEICVDAKVNALKFETLKESQNKIAEIQQLHDSRITILEKNSLLMTSEFANLKQNQDKQSILMLELDKSSTEKNDKMFDKVLVAQQKTEENSAKKLDEMSTLQNSYLTQIIQSQNTTKQNKFELTKAKLGIICAGIGGFMAIVLFVLSVIF